MPRICEPINGIKYMITNPDDFIQQQLINGQQNNNDIFNIIKEYISKYQLTHLVNVGTHIGTMCLPLSLHMSKITGFEAYPPTYSHLCKNININNIKNLYVRNLALGNCEENIYFMSENKICPKEHKNRLKNNSGGMHVFTQYELDNNIRSSNLTDKKITAPMGILDKLEVDSFDIMLVDIEGAEYNFLQGARNKIVKNHPIIIIEIWDNNKRKNENMDTKQEEIIDYICELGYKVEKNIGDDFIFLPLDIEADTNK